MARTDAVRTPGEQPHRSPRRDRGRFPLPPLSRVPRGDPGQAGRDLARRSTDLLTRARLAVQGPHPPDLGEDAHPEPGHQPRADTADENGWYHAEQGRRDARLEIAELIRGPGKQRVDGRDS